MYLTNASAMWTALVPDSRAATGHLRIDRSRVTRLILSAPATAPAITSLLADLPVTGAVVVEDVFSAEEPQTTGTSVRVLRMPVMTRPPASLAPTSPSQVRVVQVVDLTELAEAERVIVDGFPVPVYQPWVRSQALPPRVLDLPGWRVWLAYRGDRPAAAAYTYDDGFAVGVYWLATLSEHRSHGLARAILTKAIRAHPDRACTLVATEAGRPLYESLGFGTVTTATWYMRPSLVPGQAG